MELSNQGDSIMSTLFEQQGDCYEKQGDYMLACIALLIETM